MNIWVERGYSRESSELYLETISKQLSSPNTVLDVRFPQGGEFVQAFTDSIHNYLMASQTMPMTYRDKIAVADEINAKWKVMIQEFDRKQLDDGSKLKALYQKSLLNCQREPRRNRVATVWVLIADGPYCRPDCLHLQSASNAGRETQIR